MAPRAASELVSSHPATQTGETRRSCTRNENRNPNSQLPRRAGLAAAVPRKSRAEHAQQHYHQGPWSSHERLQFLRGLRLYGMGRWKEIGTILTTRYVAGTTIPAIIPAAILLTVAVAVASVCTVDSIHSPHAPYHRSITLRSNKQIKSHGQKMELAIFSNQHVYAELEAAEAAEAALQGVDHACSRDDERTVLEASLHTDAPHQITTSGSSSSSSNDTTPSATNASNTPVDGWALENEATCAALLLYQLKTVDTVCM